MTKEEIIAEIETMEETLPALRINREYCERQLENAERELNDIELYIASIQDRINFLETKLETYE